MTFGKKKEEPAAVIPPASPAPAVQSQREPTFLEKEQQELHKAKIVLVAAQTEVARIQANVSWLEMNPIAEKVFRDIIEREIHRRDREELNKLVPTDREKL
jgi:hypothetical protein